MRQVLMIGSMIPNTETHFARLKDIIFAILSHQHQKKVGYQKVEILKSFVGGGGFCGTRNQ